MRERERGSYALGLGQHIKMYIICFVGNLLNQQVSKYFTYHLMKLWFSEDRTQNLHVLRLETRS
jgi:hypothetical protein